MSVEWTKVKLMKDYLIENGVDESEVIKMGVKAIIDMYYKKKGVNL